MERWKRGLRNILDRIIGTKLRYRMLILYFVGGVLPSILIGSYLIRGTNKELIERAKTAEITEMQMACRQTREILATVSRVSKLFLFNEKLEKIAFEQYDDYQKMVDDYRATYMEFVDYGQYYNSLVSRFSVYLENETIKGNSQFVKVNDEIKEQQWYRNVVEKEGGVCWQYIPDTSNKYESLVLTRLLKTKKRENVGVLVLHIQSNRMTEIIKEREYDTMIILNGSDMIAGRKQNQITFDQISSMIPNKEKETWQKIVIVDGEEYVMTCISIDVPESSDYIQMVGLHSFEDILKETDRQNRKSVYFFLAGIVGSLFMIAVFSGSFSKRVECFRSQMQKAASGNFELEKQLGGKDEISELYDYLGTMIWKIQKLLSEVYQEKLHAERLKGEQREAEFKMLTSQINPHFLYNTLEIIRMKARMNQQYEIEELVKMLAKILRKNIQAGSQEVSIQTEIELVSCYLRIQQYRFGDRIQYQIDVEPQLQQQKILPLILQPIVENSIVHGLEVKEGVGNIRISISQTGKMIKIIIEDDGVGMTEEKLIQLQKDMNKKNQNGSHIGVGNVHQRVRLRYGEEYGIKISSTHGVGTRVEIALPREGEEIEWRTERVQSDDY